jgi:hypothetical protein
MPERQQRIKGRLSNRENSRESSNLGINYSNVEVSTSRGQSFQDMGRGNQRGRRGDRIDRGREVEGERGGQDRNRSKPRGDRVRGEGRIRGNSNRGANGSQGSNRKLEVKPKGSILSRITRAAPGSQPEENDSEEDEERDDSENFEASYSDGGDEEGYSKYSDSQDNDSGLVRYSQEDGEESEEDDFRKEAQKPQPAKPRIILKRQQPQEEERKPPSSILKPYVPKIEPGLPPLVKRPSEKELTPLGRNTSTNMSSFLQDKSGDNDLLMKKYKLYLQRRKKKCADFSSELDKMLVAVEKLDTERAQCMGMCSRQEIRDRESQNNVDVFERLPGAHKRMDAQLAIKKFTRSSADKNLDIPEILRPPFFLHQSLEHIMTKVVDDDLKEVSTFVSPHSERERVEFLDIYLFVSDRLRSLRQDMNILQSHLPGIATSKLYITILEQIVRFYIISANELLDQEDFSPTVNQTALSSVSTSLVDSYSLARKSLANLIGKSSE